MVNNDHANYIFESSVRNFDKIFNDKLKYKVGKLKKDTSISIDDKVADLQKSIIK